MKYKVDTKNVAQLRQHFISAQQNNKEMYFVARLIVFHASALVMRVTAAGVASSVVSVSEPTSLTLTFTRSKKSMASNCSKFDCEVEA